MADGEIKISSNESAKAKFGEVRDRLRKASKELDASFKEKVRAIVEPLKEEVSSSAEETLPKKGGLAERVASSDYSVTVNLKSVRFRMTSPLDLKPIDRGKLRHPVFGHAPWVNQTVSSGFWSRPVDKAKKEISAAIVETIQEVVKDLGA